MSIELDAAPQNRLLGTMRPSGLLLVLIKPTPTHIISSRWLTTTTTTTSTTVLWAPVSAMTTNRRLPCEPRPGQFVRPDSRDSCIPVNFSPFFTFSTAHNRILNSPGTSSVPGVHELLEGIRVRRRRRGKVDKCLPPGFVENQLFTDHLRCKCLSSKVARH